ncbi:hypothetical protein DFS33DRAFT_1449260 [Desarmillaria ectypa]|nr:hypothetical protein DFS33DRAFT_1449260 [Desarmillaria ectypa]
MDSDINLYLKPRFVCSQLGNRPWMLIRPRFFYGPFFPAWQPIPPDATEVHTVHSPALAPALTKLEAEIIPDCDTYLVSDCKYESVKLVFGNKAPPLPPRRGRNAKNVPGYWKMVDDTALPIGLGGELVDVDVDLQQILGPIVKLRTELFNRTDHCWMSDEDLRVIFASISRGSISGSNTKSSIPDDPEPSISKPPFPSRSGRPIKPSLANFFYYYYTGDECISLGNFDLAAKIGFDIENASNLRTTFILSYSCPVVPSDFFSILLEVRYKAADRVTSFYQDETIENFGRTVSGAKNERITEYQKTLPEDGLANRSGKLDLPSIKATPCITTRYKVDDSNSTGHLYASRTRANTISQNVKILIYSCQTSSTTSSQGDGWMRANNIAQEARDILATAKEDSERENALVLLRKILNPNSVDSDFYRQRREDQIRKNEEHWRYRNQEFKLAEEGKRFSNDISRTSGFDPGV